MIDGFGRTSQSWGLLLQRLANGRISNYLQGFVWGLLIIIGWFLLRSVA